MICDIQKKLQQCIKISLPHCIPTSRVGGVELSANKPSTIERCSALVSLASLSFLRLGALVKQNRVGTASGFSVRLLGPNPAITDETKQSSLKCWLHTQTFLSCIGGSTNRNLSSHWWAWNLIWSQRTQALLSPIRKFLPVLTSLASWATIDENLLLVEHYAGHYRSQMQYNTRASSCNSTSAIEIYWNVIDLGTSDVKPQLIMAAKKGVCHHHFSA